MVIGPGQKGSLLTKYLRGKVCRVDGRADGGSCRDGNEVIRPR
jgi:hypothetical protein